MSEGHINSFSSQGRNIFHSSSILTEVIESSKVFSLNEMLEASNSAGSADVHDHYILEFENEYKIQDIFSASMLMHCQMNGEK